MQSTVSKTVDSRFPDSFAFHNVSVDGNALPKENHLRSVIGIVFNAVEDVYPLVNPALVGGIGPLLYMVQKEERRIGKRSRNSKAAEALTDK